MKDLIKQIKLALSITVELTPAESLKCIVEDNKHERLLNDIRAIRTKGDYVPDYNKPKKYTDYKLKRKVWEFLSEKNEYVYLGEAQVTANTITTQKRPVEFGSDIEAWFKSIRKSFVSIQEEKVQRTEQYHNFIEQRFDSSRRLMNHFTQIN